MVTLAPVAVDTDDEPATASHAESEHPPCGDAPIMLIVLPVATATELLGGEIALLTLGDTIASELDVEVVLVVLALVVLLQEVELVVVVEGVECTKYECRQGGTTARKVSARFTNSSSWSLFADGITEPIPLPPRKRGEVSTFSDSSGRMSRPGLINKMV